MEPGVHLIHKPVGQTSFQTMREQLARFPGLSGRRARACHGGTLDPFAHGLLVILTGGATKVLDLLHAAPKRYVAQVIWGSETDNGDPLGRVVAEGDASRLKPALLDDALSPFLGWTEQVPPTTSAKKIGGEPAYRLVHRGEHVELPPSRVFLHSARWLSHDLPRSSTLEMVCRGGYYVRALARDLGRALECRAHLQTLHRAQIGPWLDPAPAELKSFRGTDILPWATQRLLSDAEVGELRAGSTIRRGSLPPPAWTVPAGFPDPSPPVMGIHRDRVVFLLDAVTEGLRTRTMLPGGV